MPKKSEAELIRQAELIEDAWLGIDKTSDEIFNPFENIPDEYRDDPQRYFMWLISQPEYFSFICKYILKIELYPFQLLILRELWTKKFPILIGTRGMSKCVNGNTLIMTNDGVVKIGDLVGWDSPEQMRVYNLPNVLNEKALFNEVEYGWNNGYGKTIKLETSQGFIIEGVPDHRIRIVRDGTFQWMELKNIVKTDYVPIERTPNWFENTTYIDEELAYLFGLINGDGGFTVRGRIGFTSTDQQLHDSFSSLMKRFFNKEIHNSGEDITKHIYSTEVWDCLFSKYGFSSSECGKKSFPKCILSANKSSAKAFIQGLMDTDGWSADKKLAVGFCSKSEEMVRTLQFFLTRFGIISRVKNRLNKKYNKYYYYLYILGDDAKKFCEEIGFRLKHKQEKLERNCNVRSNTNKDIVPREMVKDYFTRNKLLEKISTAKNISYDKLSRLISSKNDTSLDYILESHYFYDTIHSIDNSECQTFDVHCKNDHSFITNGIISHNTFTLAIYCLLRMILMPGRKIVLTGAVFRQSKLIFEYMERIWNNSPILRDLYGDSRANGPHHENDAWKFILGESITYALPIGDGSTIRGYRANDIVCDEFASINLEVFEHVIKGFAMVSADPINNSKRLARIRKSAELGIITDEVKEGNYKTNQVILSGTAYYEFNHFYKYWKKNRDIILTRGDKKKLAEMGEDPEVNPDDYAIIRIPYDMLPEGLMDKDIIASARGNLHISLFQMEVMSCFSADSNGFFKRSLLETCNGEYGIMTHGENGRQYVLGIDPASESDNFCIVLCEVTKNVRKICYCWTTTKQSYKSELKAGRAKENDFYDYCCRKILNLCNAFNIIGIAIDTQGGGHAVVGRLHNPSIIKSENNEVPLWPFIDPDEPSEDDIAEGRHIIELINFADADWTSTANHTLRLEFETRAILFPKFDQLTFAQIDLSSVDDIAKSEATEEAVLEIEEMKNELSSIVMNQTPSGRDRWDTPDQKLPGSKKGRMKKDRYSALLMAAYMGRKLVEEKRVINYSSDGGLARQFTPDQLSGQVGFVGGNAIGAKLAKQLTDLYAGY